MLPAGLPADLQRAHAWNNQSVCNTGGFILTPDYLIVVDFERI